MFEVARKLVLTCDDLVDVWNKSDEILAAEQENWDQRLFEFQEQFCSGTGWLHFNKSDELLEWIGCVLGESMMPVPYTNRPDFGGEPLHSRFRTARQRYLEPK